LFPTASPSLLHTQTPAKENEMKVKKYTKLVQQNRKESEEYSGGVLAYSIIGRK
jgi:hypothetical protein